MAKRPPKQRIHAQVKLKLNATQQTTLNEWLWVLTGVYNWALRKIELSAQDRIYYSEMEFTNLLAGHSKKLGLPSHVLQAVLRQAYTSWQRCYQGLSRKPRMRGNRNKLNSIPFPDPIRPPKDGRFSLPAVGSLKYFKQDLPEGAMKCGRIIKRASGWYLCLAIDAAPKPIPATGQKVCGIDPGLKSLITLSDGRAVPPPKEYQRTEHRLGQAQRGGNKRLVARLHERIANQRKDRNHKLSRELVAEHSLIAWSDDNLRWLQKAFGKAAGSNGLGQLSRMIEYKSRAGGVRFIRVASRHTTKTCSACGRLTGPTGYAGLSVRAWVCSCGAEHDRDVNAAINILTLGAGYALERTREGASETTC